MSRNAFSMGFALTAVSLALAACGGGGGGGNADGGVTTPPPPVTQFTWSNALKAGATVTVQGKAVEIAQKFVGFQPVKTGPIQGSASFTETLDASGALSALTVTGPGYTNSFSKAAGDTFGTALTYVITATSADKSHTAIAIDPLLIGWNYQSVGVWENHRFNPAEGVTYNADVASVGSVTDAGAIPATARATFRGEATAYYADGVSAALGVAPATLSADFAAHSVDFATGAFKVVSYPDALNSGLQGFIPNTALVGGMTYAAGSNSLNGTVSGVGVYGSSTGVLTGQFYGPNAQEIGGNFSIGQLGAGSALIGAYGATTAPKADAPLSFRGKLQALTRSRFGGFSPPTNATDAVLTVTRNTAGAVTGVQFNGDYQFDFSSGAYANSSDGALAITGSGAVNAALTANTAQLGWNYQTFGAWAQLVVLDTSYGAASAGLNTAGSAIPTTGAATFQGKAGGYNLSGLISADVTLNANFASRSVTFASTAFKDLTTGAALNDTVLTGSMTYAAGANALSGSVQTTDGRLTGGLTGQFYGPAAEEIGGLFALTPTAGAANQNERLGGAFGAKR